MKPLPFLTAALVIGLALGLPTIAQAQAPDPPVAAATEDAAAPVVLNLNINTNPPTLDPALASDSTSTTVIEQLFIGLVDLDDTTAEVKPDLAKSWAISPDGTVYTFTLRDDAFWSDGKPITAQDVRYGILRTLDPATKAAYASLFDIIKNAKFYRTGALADPNQVGVTVVNPITLRITLEYPASYALSMLALWPARPMPQWAIEAHGVPAWTLPSNIVTSGPYRLAEWVTNDHIRLDKNPSYFGAASVQIDQVNMAMVDDPAAWTLYLNGELDTAAVPGPGLLDPAQRQALHIQPVACTHYYGFSLSQPPFDNLLVRKAFIAAVDRQGLIDAVLGGVPRPAQTFTPPGLFGHVDGPAEGVGIPFNPNQARQWLSDAGYPNGQGLPPITLWYNTSPSLKPTAEYVRESWRKHLGVEVSLADMDWTQYLDEIDKGRFQVFRFAWCADYLDGYNFLHDAVIPQRSIYGNWANATYDTLINQMASEQDPAVRKKLMKQAEEILVESDAVMMPLYYGASITASAPYLQRTYSALKYDLATWRITRATTTADPASGAVLISDDGSATVDIPPATFTQPVTVTHAPAYALPPAGDLSQVGQVFDLSAVYTDTGQAAQPAPGASYTVTVAYADGEVGPAIEDTLALYWWDGTTWSQDGIASSVDVAANTVTAQVDHFSLFAVLGDTQRVLLPATLKRY